MKSTFSFNTSKLGAGVKKLLAMYTDIRHLAMTDASQYMRMQAQKRCPVDEGNLTNDITPGTEVNEKSESAIVYIPVNAPSRDYAIPMHEHTYKLGENSKAKQTKVGVTVGNGYLTRAITENLATIKAIIVDRLKEMKW